MKAALVQTNPKENRTKNLSDAETFIRLAASQGCELIVLPEMFAYMGDNVGRLQTSDYFGEGTFLWAKTLAKELGILLVAGSIGELPEKSDSDTQKQTKVFNTAVAYDKNGELLSRYRKIHLFNLRDPQGQALYCESESFDSGNSPAFFSFKDRDGQTWNAGLSICYDIRFPELYRSSAIQNQPAADIQFLPAAFTHQTGKDHWEILCKARAIENQCYFLACNQAGFFLQDTKQNWGHSSIIGPWGEILNQARHETGLVVSDLSYDKLLESRSKLPALQDRKIKVPFVI